ncbi:MAG: RnfABCDGE type electron transport complex subunit D [Candidatus Bipolaricaulia bacterium]
MRVGEQIDRLFTKALERLEGNPRLKIIVEGTRESLFGSSYRTAREVPFLRDSLGMQRYMIMPILAVLPAALASIYFYGWRALAIIAVSYFFGALTELTFCAVRRVEISEGLLVTGILYPLTLPPTLPLWMVALGVIVGVAVGKELFGGTGYNVFNPALVGRAFLAFAFPVQMTNYWFEPFQAGLGGFLHYAPAADAITKSTPLIQMKFDHVATPWLELLWGNTAGSLGETSALLLILGGLFLILTKTIDWRVPLGYVGSLGLFSWLLWAVAPERFAGPVFQILAGGLLLGAFFMATDPVTSPITTRGRWAFAIAVGLLTVAIRSFTGFAEGVMFAILLGNMFTPLLDRLTLPRGLKGARVEG